MQSISKPDQKSEVEQRVCLMELACCPTVIVWHRLALHDQQCAKQRKRQRQPSWLHAKTEQSNYWEISVKRWTWETTPHWGCTVPEICSDVYAQSSVCQTSSISSEWFNFTNTGRRFVSGLEQSAIYILCERRSALSASVKCFHIIPFWILNTN